MKRTLQYSMILFVCALFGCAGGGGGGESSDASPVVTSDHAAALEAYEALPWVRDDFVLTVCAHPDWLDHPLGTDLDGALSYAVAVLEAPPVPDTDADVVPPWELDFLTLVLHELLHVKGIHRAHLTDDQDGIMNAAQDYGERGRQRMPTAADYALLATSRQIYRLEYVGVTDDCDVPTGFKDLTTPGHIGTTFWSARPVLVWFDAFTDFYVPEL